MPGCGPARSGRRRVVLARGPGLETEGAEVPALAPLYDDVTVLADTDASSKRLLDALDGAWLGHIAAHGTFRADSPLFSSLRMADGPLTVYDFEQLHRAPHRLILPSCDSGRLALAGADELLGLTSSLLPLGTAGVVASIAPLNDRAAVPLMLSLHQHLRAGQTLAGSLCTIRCQVSDDPSPPRRGLVTHGPGRGIGTTPRAPGPDRPHLAHADAAGPGRSSAPAPVPPLWSRAPAWELLLRRSAPAPA